MFRPTAQFEYKIPSRGLSSWLRAEIHPNFIRWTVIQEILMTTGVVSRTVMIEATSITVQIEHTQNYSEEFRLRLLKSNAWSICRVIMQSTTDASADLLTQIFKELYYPEEKEDEYNAWVKEFAPNLHELMIKNLRQQNLQMVSEIMEEPLIQVSAYDDLL